MEQHSHQKDAEFEKIDQLYDECLDYLKNLREYKNNNTSFEETDFDEYEEEEDPDYEAINFVSEDHLKNKTNENQTTKPDYEAIVFEAEEHQKHKTNENQTTKPDYEDIIFESEEHQKNKTNENQITKTNEQFKENAEALDKSIKNEPEFKVINETGKEFIHENRLRRLSQQLPKIIITQSNTSLNVKDDQEKLLRKEFAKSDGSLIRATRKEDRDNKLKKRRTDPFLKNGNHHEPLIRSRTAYGEFPKRLVSKSGTENVSVISNVPFEKIRLLNDTFHTLINLRWRWIVLSTIVTHFTIWLVFAVFWYITALAHYDFSPNPPAKLCVTGGKDFVTIFLASVEAQTTIGFGDRAIDEECPESIFLFIMQLILGTGLSGVLTCVVYAKLTRPEKLSRDGVGFSKKAIISMRDGYLCLMVRAWDLNYDHIISSEFSAHFVNTYKTKEGEVIRYYARNLPLQQRLFLLWPVTLVHVIDENSPLYNYTPQLIANNNYEITVSLKGASASMGTFTQSQTSYTPREVLWGHRFPSVVKYDSRKQKYIIEHKKLDLVEPIDTPLCRASELYNSTKKPPSPSKTPTPESPSNFSEQIAAFTLNRSSSFRNKK